MGTVEKAGAGRAGSALSPLYFLPDPAHPAPAYLIVPTDREPGTGYCEKNRFTTVLHTKALATTKGNIYIYGGLLFTR